MGIPIYIFSAVRSKKMADSFNFSTLNNKYLDGFGQTKSIGISIEMHQTTLQMEPIHAKTLTCFEKFETLLAVHI